MICPRLAVALLLSAVAFAAMPAQAQTTDDPRSGSGCQGDIEVQTGPYNHYGCSDCAGSIIVQVGHTNNIACRGDVCNGNIVVQVGVVNDANCATGGLHTSTSSASVAGFPCPSQLPDDNFYCYLASYLLPNEVCLSLDFCLW